MQNESGLADPEPILVFLRGHGKCVLTQCARLLLGSFLGEKGIFAQ